MLFFVALAAFLWIVIKLSDTYTETNTFTVIFSDAPADKVIHDDTHTIKVTMTATGFKLLNFYIRIAPKRQVTVSLKEDPYSYVKDNEYSFNPAIIAEDIAAFLETGPSDVTVSEDEITFIMDDLEHKKVPVTPDLRMSFVQQYNTYSLPVVVPDSIDIYGSKGLIEKLLSVKTEPITLKNVNKDVNVEALVDLGDEHLNSDIKKVKIFIDVEKYTENSTEIIIDQAVNSNLRLFPDRVTVRYMVALKDFLNINSLSFKAEVDTFNINAKDHLAVGLTQHPINTKIIGVEPSEVEYIIIQDD